MTPTTNSATNMQTRSRLFRTIPVLPLLIAIIALAAVTLASLATPAQAQTVVDLVSNTAETVETGGSNAFFANSFETGANADAYTITDVSVRIESVTSEQTTAATIRENGNDNLPGNVVVALTNPDTLTGGSLNVFTAPADTTLESNTTYWLSVNDGIASNRLSYTGTASDSETGETGWSISNTRRWRHNESNDWGSEAVSLHFRIRGYANTVPTASDGSVLTTANIAYTFDARRLQLRRHRHRRHPREGQDRHPTRQRGP